MVVQVEDHEEDLGADVGGAREDVEAKAENPAAFAERVGKRVDGVGHQFFKIGFRRF